MASTTMGNQLKGTNAVWLTPPEILAALGAFDLDPCAAPHRALGQQPLTTLSYLKTAWEPLG